MVIFFIYLQIYIIFIYRDVLTNYAIGASLAWLNLPSGIQRWWVGFRSKPGHSTRSKCPLCSTDLETWFISAQRPGRWGQGKGSICLQTMLGTLMAGNGAMLPCCLQKPQFSPQMGKASWLWSQVWVTTAQEHRCRLSKFHVPVWQQFDEVWLCFYEVG